MHDRRSLEPDLLPLDDHINSLGRRRRSQVSADNSSVSSSDDMEPHPEMDLALARPMKDYARPVVETSPSCILLVAAARNYELKTVHFNMLPKFSGAATEDALTFIRDFYATIQTFPLLGLTEDQLRMRCFPYTMKDRAK